MKYLVTISGFETRNDVIFYKITVNGLHNSKVIYKRYSDLRALNEQLIQKNHEFKLKLNLPKFPKKKLFGRTKHSETDIVTRGLELQQYLEIILNTSMLWTFSFIRDLQPLNEAFEESINQLCTNHQYTKDVCWPQMQELKQQYLQRHDVSSSPSKSQSKKTNGYKQRYYFKFEEYVKQQDYVLYSVTLTDQKKNIKYQFNTRYSKLKDYHSLLENKQFKNQLPPFPKRKLIGQTFDNPDEIHERQNQLETYLNEIFSIKELVSSEPLVYFIIRIKLESKAIQEFDQHHRCSRYSQQVNCSSLEKEPFEIPKNIQSC
ncbi:unnamed protein product (macronuclear) [Paramecium tetraurelia]|uniref:PX domain-containing protein n=1 Tax=Paramecium tetraurelia TaxID=5888 RepID=A0DF55_PARTE|nr:uncharacterized protein GSPATT00016485001 [Paramecium tetraurelia]CAK81672.1 unnamed protein product [Paramecium tetraurelia]|eukprot:XP_001449069.1 hypothetical protein (macronuclear) [Paramecium tetraurelia strain d4-2]